MPGPAATSPVVCWTVVSGADAAVSSDVSAAGAGVSAGVSGVELVGVSGCGVSGWIEISGTWEAYSYESVSENRV